MKNIYPILGFALGIILINDIILTGILVKKTNDIYVRYAELEQYNSLIEQEINIEGNLKLIKDIQSHMEPEGINSESLKKQLAASIETYNLAVDRYEHDKNNYQWDKEKQFKNYSKINN